MKLKALLWLGLVLVVFIPSKAFCQKFILSGTITDIITGKPIPGVLLTSDEIRCFSNQYGGYMFFIGYGEHNVNIQSAGYRDYNIRIKTYNDEVFNIALLRTPDLAALRKTSQILQNDSMGTNSGKYIIDNKKLNRLPVLFGESDLLKNLQFAPGVYKNRSGVVYTSIRGCNTNQTNFFVDGVPIYNIQHASGYMSVFAEGDFSHTELVKSGLGANLGGRSGGAVLFTPNEGDTKKISGGYQLSLPVFSLNLNGPIGKRLTYSVSYRRTYIDWLFKPFSNDSSKIAYHFYDLNVRLKFILNKKNNLYFQIINNIDALFIYRKETEAKGNGKTNEVKINENIKYGGYTSWLKWERTKAKGYSTLCFAVNNINSLFAIKVDENLIAGAFVTPISKSNWDNSRGFNSIGVMYDEYIVRPKGNVLFGGNFWLENYETGSQKKFQTSGATILYDTTYRFEPKVRQYTGALYGSLNKHWDNGHKSVTIGARLSMALVGGKFFIVPEPRISYYQLLSKNWHFKMSYDRTGQMKNYLQPTYIGIVRTDQWLPVSSVNGPQVNDQLSVQLIKTISRKWSFEGNAYYIYMERVSLPNPGAKQTNYFSNSVDFNWHNQLVQGSGKSYGTELILHKNAGLSKGWISWCQTWSYRKIENYNGGNFFRYNLDRKSDLTLAMTHQWQRRIIWGTTLVLSGGFPISIPISKFSLPQGTQNYPNWQGQQVLLYGGKNNSTFGLFKRIDFNMNLIGKHPDGRKHQVFTITLYNLLSSFNPEVLNYTYDKQTKQYKLIANWSFPLIPAIGYQYRF